VKFDWNSIVTKTGVVVIIQQNLVVEHFEAALKGHGFSRAVTGAFSLRL
jgi:hypothetical protein